MNKTIITFVSVAVIIGGFLIFFQNRASEKRVLANSQQINTAQKWETKTEEKANVTIVVTPIDLSKQSSEWKFDIGMNTHSVELNQDMTKVAVLVDDLGREYKPTRWEGPVGSHHREGMLVFDPINPYPKYLTLRINDIGGVQRSQSWTLIKE